MASSSGPQYDLHSEDYVKDVRIRFREQAARFLEDVSFDVGAVLARDLSLQDEDTKFRLSELQKGLTEQVQHMQKVIKKEKSVLVASTVHRHKKDIHFTQNELKTLHEIAMQENDANGVVTMFLKRREEGVARNRYKEFLKRAEAKYFEHRRDGRRGKFDFRHIIRDSMRPVPAAARPAEPKHKSHRVPKLTMPGVGAEALSATAAATTTTTTAVSSLQRSTGGSPTGSVRSAPDPVSAPPPPASCRPPVRSARWSPPPVDPVDDEVRLIVDELAETVDLLVDFEHQPFQTAVPPQYAFYQRPDAQPESGERSVAGSDEGRPDQDEEDNDEVVLGEPVAPADDDGGAETKEEESAANDDPQEDDDAGEQDLDAATTLGDEEDEEEEETTVLEIMQAALAEESIAEDDPCASPDDDDDDDDDDNRIESVEEPAAIADAKSTEPSETAATAAVETPAAEAPADKPKAPRPTRTRSDSLRFMAPKRSQADLAQRCHRKSRETKATLPNPRRNGRRSRSPWRYPERFPQIRETQTRPKKPPPAKPLLRTQSTTKLREAK